MASAISRHWITWLRSQIASASDLNPTVTREPFRNRGRITDLISSEQLFNDIHQAPLNIETDRIMMCGSPGMLDELKQMFESGGFLEGSHNTPGHFVIEKAFVER